jgi:hypothetical protein
LGGKSGRGRCNGLDRHGLARCLALGGLLQNLDLAINTQNFGHLLLELGIATFQIIPNLVRLDFRLAEDLAYRSLRQIGETLMSEGRSILACMARQQPCRQLVRMTVILGLIASQGHQPSLSLRCNRPFTARARPIIQSSHRAIGKRSLDAAFNGLMMHANHLPNSEERRCLTYASSTRARSTRRAASLRERAMSASFSISSSVIANSTACRHPAMPKLLV